MTTYWRFPRIALVVLALSSGCGPPPPTGDSNPALNEMQFVPGADFRMGSDLAELDEVRTQTGLARNDVLMPEVPSRQVTVDSFYLDTVDVTNRRFSEFTEAVTAWRPGRIDRSLHNGRYLEHWVSDSPPTELLDHPVTFITWQAAVEYCAWRGKRLPTEIEYEWAARGGQNTGQYPWGDAPPDSRFVNWSGSGIGKTAPVASYPPNARGLYDMAGNVWRFTADPWLGSYAEMPTDPAEISRAATNPAVRRVVRGGSYGANAANLRLRYRDSHRPLDAREMVGFRCAKSGMPPQDASDDR